MARKALTGYRAAQVATVVARRKGALAEDAKFSGPAMYRRRNEGVFGEKRADGLIDGDKFAEWLAAWCERALTRGATTKVDVEALADEYAL